MHSWHLLTPRQQKTFAQLAVFHSGFTKQAASHVINATQADVHALLAKSLLQHSEGRFDMHQLVHDFAAQKLALMDETACPAGLEAHERHASYYLAFLAQQEQKIEEAINREPLIESGRELNNIRAAWRWAVTQNKVELLVQSASGFRLLAEQLGLIQEGIAAMQSGIKQLAEGASEALAVLLLQQAILLNQTTNLDLALSSVQKAAQLATNPQTLGWVSYYCGVIYTVRSNYKGAQDKLLQAQTFFRQTGSQEGQKKALHSLGVLASNLEEYTKAKHYFEQLYHLVPDEKNTRFKGAISLNLGVAHRMQGHYNQARILGDTALTLFRQIGEPYWEGLAILNHALLALHLGNYEQAARNFEQTDNLWRQGGFERHNDALYALWGLYYEHLGDHKKTLVYAEQAKEISRAKADLYHLGLAWLVIGHAKRALGLKEAKKAYQESLSAWQSISKQKASMEALGGLAAVAYEQKRVDEAHSCVEQIMSHRKENPTLVGTLESMRILLICIKVLEAAGQTERADVLLEESYQLLMQRANDLEDEKLRESFLHAPRVPFHREIVRRWREKWSIEL